MHDYHLHYFLKIENKVIRPHSFMRLWNWKKGERLSFALDMFRIWRLWSQSKVKIEIDTTHVWAFWDHNASKMSYVNTMLKNGSPLLWHPMHKTHKQNNLSWLNIYCGCTYFSWLRSSLVEHMSASSEVFHALILRRSRREFNTNWIWFISNIHWNNCSS